MSCCLALFLNHLIRFAGAPILVLIKEEFDLSFTLIGAIQLLASFAYMLSIFIFGVLADKFGGKRVLIMGVLLYSITTFLIALSRFLWQFILFYVLTFLFTATHYPAVTRLIAESYTLKSRGKAFGIHEGAGAFGRSASPLISSLLGQTRGWRWSFGMLSFLGLVITLFLQVSISRQKFYTKRVKESTNFRSRMLSTQLILLGIILSLVFMSRGISFWTFMPLFLIDEKRLAIMDVSILLAIYGVGSIISGPFGGLLADKFGRKAIIVLSGCISTILFYFFMIMPPGIFLSFAFCIFGVFGPMAIGVLITRIVDIAPRHCISVTTGSLLMLGHVGNSIGPLIVLFLSESLGFFPAFQWLLAISIVGTIIASKIKEGT